MIEEESQFPTKSIFLLIMIVALVAVIALAIWLFFTVSVEAETRFLDRASVEISDALVKSPLTSELAVFKEEELDKYDGTRIEPYFRHCKYGYSVKIKKEGKEWKFGYEPEEFIKSKEEAKSIFPVSVINSQGKIEPAMMEVNVYDTLLTRISCVIEGAYLSKDIVKVDLDCPREIVNEYWNCGFVIRRQNGDPNSDFICVTDSEGEEDKNCKYLPDIPLPQQGLFFGSNTKKIGELKAIPVENSLAQSAVGKPCSELEKIKAGEDKDAVIIMCFYEPEGETQAEITVIDTEIDEDIYCRVNFNVENTGSSDWTQESKVMAVVYCIPGIQDGDFIPGYGIYMIALTANPDEIIPSNVVPLYDQFCHKSSPQDEDYRIELYANCDDREPNCGPYAKPLAETTFRCE